LLAVWDPWEIYFLMFLPNFICVGIAVASSFIVQRLGRAIREARELGSYTLEERLGIGGMGEVWRARHKMLARPAAIKLIRSDASTAGSALNVDTVLQRFDREAQATALLTSPHTVQIYDFGVSEDQTFYYVMELLHGLDLDTMVVKFGPFPAERVIHVLRQACHSLREAHQRGLVHRDIKPANLFACYYGDDCDHVKVLDFGLVKFDGEAEGQAPHLTLQGVAAGTPATMAPEIARGLPADERADIYGLGCVAYWLLTGYPVFEGSTSVDVISQHLQKPPVPPSRRTELEVPVELERIVMQCLEKDPRARPASASELLDRLTECPRAEEWTSERAARWWRGHLPDMMAPPNSEPAPGPA
jgi:serine/threonine-protein kinase